MECARVPPLGRARGRSWPMRCELADTRPGPPGQSLATTGSHGNHHHHQVSSTMASASPLRDGLEISQIPHLNNFHMFSPLLVPLAPSIGHLETSCWGCGQNIDHNFHTFSQINKDMLRFPSLGIIKAEVAGRLSEVNYQLEKQRRCWSCFILSIQQNKLHSREINPHKFSVQKYFHTRFD